MSDSRTSAKSNDKLTKLTESLLSSQGNMAWTDRFSSRHIGPDAEEASKMLAVCGYSSIDAMANAAIPASIRLKKPLNLPVDRSETGALSELKSIASRNDVWRSFIGVGYYDCITPPVILRNILENPGWYTQYTPYQAEISQGRLEALLNFQTMVTDLTGLEVANASLLDEGTAAAEAMMMCHTLKGKEGGKAFFVSEVCHPQTIEVVKTRASALGIEVIVGNHQTFAFERPVFGVLLQYPATDGVIHNYRPFIEQAHAHDAMAVVAADLLSLVLLTPPGEFAADVAVGSVQRFGVPLGFGGPHAAYLATRDSFKRCMPGRLIGISKDSSGRPGLRLTLQTREQHIRREKATSNICTAQVLLAVMASMYAVYHGPEGLQAIAGRVRRMTLMLAEGLRRLGYSLGDHPVFDTLLVGLGNRSCKDIVKVAAKHRINLRVINDRMVGISLDEAVTRDELQTLLVIFNLNAPLPFTLESLAEGGNVPLPDSCRRQSAILTHKVFQSCRSETEMLRYIRKLESRDLSLTTSMIPLGSCTMKLNAAAEMLPITWPEFARMHPFAPEDQTQGYRLLFHQLETWLAEITGFAAVSLQPNAGSQGEYAGLLVVRAYLDATGQGARRVCLIPSSAHGTNPASAVMAGLRVVPVACDECGNISLEDLKAKATAHKNELAVLMVTYPSTHGVFEEGIKDICQIIHENGGQVYMDGANMNAQVGLCSPGEIGADVCHLNLHKTFAMPHGGGGPGMAPICVASHLAPYLPGHPLVKLDGKKRSGPISAAPWGSASILPIAWMYIRMMGAKGLESATKYAILNANYIAKRLESCFPVLYKGPGGLVAHECILDLRHFKSVTVEDVAKRLMDFGFHAPTISWPVPGTVMVEPTESESQGELDRFCDAMIQIHSEIVAIETGKIDKQDNPLKNSPHTAEVVTAETWTHPYSRQEAAYPAKWLREHKFWPSVGRIDNVHGDRNPICTCAGMDTFKE